MLASFVAIEKTLQQDGLTLMREKTFFVLGYFWKKIRRAADQEFDKFGNLVEDMKD